MTISNQDDVIDSRDIIARYNELAAISCDSPYGLEESDLEEIKALEELRKQGEDYAEDWDHGVILIRDSYFTEYAQELLEDCGSIPKDLPHYIHIDWEATARDIRVDYTPIDFSGTTYWVR